MAGFATPFVTRCPGPSPIAVTAGLLEDTAAIAFEIWLRVVKPLVLVSVLYYSCVCTVPYGVTSKDAIGGVRGTL